MIAGSGQQPWESIESAYLTVLKNILCICIRLIEDALYLYLLACTCHALTVLFQCTATNTLGKDVALVELRHRGDSGDQNKGKQMHLGRKQMHQGIVFVLNVAR